MEYDNRISIIYLFSNPHTHYSFYTIYDRNRSNRDRDYLLYEKSKELGAIAN